MTLLLLWADCFWIGVACLAVSCGRVAVCDLIFNFVFAPLACGFWLTWLMLKCLEKATDATVWEKP